MDESDDASPARTNDPGDYEFLRELAHPEKRAAFIENLRHKVQTSNDPLLRDLLHALEPAGIVIEPFSIPSRRQCGGVEIIPDLDPFWPPADVYQQAVALIVALPPSVGGGIEGETEGAKMRRWTDKLDHYGRFGKATFLGASAELCARLSSWLSGQRREEDAATIEQLGVDLARLGKPGGDQESGESVRGDLTREELALVMALEKLMAEGRITLDSFLREFARKHGVGRTQFTGFKKGACVRLVAKPKRDSCASAIREALKALEVERFTT